MGAAVAELRRDRLGLYAEAAATAREVLAAAEGGRPNHSPVVAAMARLSLGESLLLDLRLEEAQEVLGRATIGSSEDPSLAARAHVLLGRALEYSGQRDQAEVHYRVAATSPRSDVRERAARARMSPVSRAEVEGSRHLAEARRLREAGRDDAALEAYRSALALWPRCHEAALRLADEDRRRGRLQAALRVAKDVDDAEDAAPWLRTEARLVQAEARDAKGDRAGAARLYKEVFNHPFGRGDLRQRAARGLHIPQEDGDARPVGGPRGKLY